MYCQFKLESWDIHMFQKLKCKEEKIFSGSCCQVDAVAIMPTSVLALYQLSLLPVKETDPLFVLCNCGCSSLEGAKRAKRCTHYA